MVGDGAMLVENNVTISSANGDGRVEQLDWAGCRCEIAQPNKLAIVAHARVAVQDGDSQSR